jgi:MYXO-CTERM domain-containing protein
VPTTLTLPTLCALLVLGLAPARAAAQEPARFSLSMFHFNIQYVAGGLEGFPDGVSTETGFQLDERRVEDLVVTQSFEPALDLLLAHPTWKLTLELQGYMVEVMLERHPGVVDKLRQLVDEGRVELVSFHYSDQLFLAYPRVAMERSHTLLDAVMAEAGLHLSPVTFCQEGQFGEGMARLGPAHGQTILGLPKNLFRFQHAAQADAAAPLYRLEDTDVVLIGRGFDSGDLQVSWSFFDDGELWSTNDANPYFGPEFRIDPASIAEYEQGLIDQEAAGYRIATIEEYVEHVKAAGIPQPPLPPLLDGTWQPGSTESMYRWMGRSGIWDALYQCERDNEVVTGNVRTIHDVLTAELLLDWGREQGLVAPGAHAEGLSPCWREALLGQVTDASGINPFIGEVEYGLEHAARARECALAVTSDVATRAGSPFLVVDHETRAVSRQDERPREIARAVAAPFDEADGFTVDAPGRAVDVVWESVGDSGRLRRVTITARAAPTGERSMAVTFPFELAELRLSPGLVEDEVRSYPLDAFDFEDGTISLPVANGLFGLGEELWLIEDTGRVHVAATIRIGEPNVLFRDDTMDQAADATWAFFLFEGTAEEALAEANRRNTRPTVVVDGPTHLQVHGGGCACASAGGPVGYGAAAGVVLVGLVGARRRRVG